MHCRSLRDPGFFSRELRIGTQARKKDSMFRHSILGRSTIPVALVFVIALALIWFLLPGLIRKDTIASATRDAVQTVTQFKTLRGYYTKNVISKVIADGNLTPNFTHASQEKEVPLPATMIHDLSELLQDQATSINLYSVFPFPHRKDRVLDDFQLAAWEALIADPKKTVSRVDELADTQVLRVAIADTMSAPACVTCHNTHPDTPKADWALNDVRGVLEVKIVLTDDLSAGRATANLIALLLTAVGLVILAVIFLYTRRVIEPIRNLTTTMSHLAEGNTDIVIPATDSSDEVGHMARAVAVFRENAIENERVQKERQAERQQTREREAEMRQEQAASLVTLRSRQAADFEVKLLSVINNIEEATQTLSTMSANMRRNAEETGSGVENVVGRIQEMFGNMDSIYQIVQQISTLLDENRESVHRITEASTNALAEADYSNSKVSELAQACKMIGGVLKLINTITERTNLLSLNASIEAARAGEAGRGFSVVANEIKTLSDQTTEAATTINRQVEKMDQATTTVINAIQNQRESINSFSEIGSVLIQSADDQTNVTQNAVNHLENLKRGNQGIENAMADLGEFLDHEKQSAEQLSTCVANMVRSSNELKTAANTFIEELRSESTKIT